MTGMIVGGAFAIVASVVVFLVFHRVAKREQEERERRERERQEAGERDQ